MANLWSTIFSQKDFFEISLEIWEKFIFMNLGPNNIFFFKFPQFFLLKSEISELIISLSLKFMEFCKIWYNHKLSTIIVEFYTIFKIFKIGHTQCFWSILITRNTAFFAALNFTAGDFTVENFASWNFRRVKFRGRKFYRRKFRHMKFRRWSFCRNFFRVFAPSENIFSSIFVRSSSNRSLPK